MANKKKKCEIEEKSRQNKKKKNDIKKVESSLV